MTDLADRIEALSEAQIGTFTRAFIEKGADFVIIDGWSPRWQRDDVSQLSSLGLLTLDEETSERQSDEQYTALCYRPSPDFLAALASSPPNKEPNDE